MQRSTTETSLCHASNNIGSGTGGGSKSNNASPTTTALHLHDRNNSISSNSCKSSIMLKGLLILRHAPYVQSDFSKNIQWNSECISNWNGRWTYLHTEYCEDIHFLRDSFWSFSHIAKSIATVRCAQIPLVAIAVRNNSTLSIQILPAYEWLLICSTSSAGATDRRHNSIDQLRRQSRLRTVANWPTLTREHAFVRHLGSFIQQKSLAINHNTMHNPEVSRYLKIRNVLANNRFE
jgi:hypothetical protein